MFVDVDNGGKWRCRCDVRGLTMILRQTLEKPVNGYWDGGKKQVFDWTIDSQPKTDSKGQYIRIGSFAANHWFHVALGKTDKLTLSFAKRHLRAITRGTSTFKYID